MDRSLKERRAIGAYYTPMGIARSLADWALRSRTDTVLDPSFGGCAFFAAGIESLSRLGNSDPFGQLAGFDVDPKAASYLKALGGYKRNSPRFKIGEDFLAARPDGEVWCDFDAILGNPPYIRHHLLSESQIMTAQEAMEFAQISMPRTASYWPYFVLHSLSFLRPGGRLAMVLPLAAINAKYATKVQEKIHAGFSSVTLVHVQERLFSDAQEGSVLILADGWQVAGDHRRVMTAESSDTVNRVCANRVVGDSTLPADWRSWRRDGLTAANAILTGLAERRDVHELGKIAKIRVGTVTGANGFFVMCPSRAKRLGIAERYFLSVVSSASQFQSLVLSDKEIAQLINDDQECGLFVPPKGIASKAVEAYLRSRKARAAAKRYKCKIRNPWYQITDIQAPDAFLTYVNGIMPKLVLNHAGALCTNAVHRIFWKERESRKSQKLIALSFISTLGGLSAELCGRAYGGGVLKLEPIDAAKLIIATPELQAELIDAFFGKVCKLANIGSWCEARSVADELVLERGLGLKKDDVAELRSALIEMQSLRVPANSCHP